MNGVWQSAQNGQMEFASGKEAWTAAAVQASACQGFAADVEEEWIADDPRSCYNCRYRRWSVASFTCHWQPRNPA